jgi:hypothetical protein
MLGSRTSSGRLLRTLAIFSRTSWTAALASLSSENDTMTTENPSLERAWTLSTPGAATIASSIRRVTWLSTSLGLAPG